MTQSTRQMNLSDESITIIENFYGLLHGLGKEYATLREELSTVNCEQQDLLHEFEFSPLSASDRSVVAGKMIEVRKRRRQIDNAIKIIGPAVDFCNSHKSLVISLCHLQIKMRGIKAGLEGRQYTPRVRTDIKLYQGALAREGAEDE